MTKKAKWFFCFVLFALSGIGSQFLFATSGETLVWGLGFPFFLLALVLFGFLTSSLPPQSIPEEPLPPVTAFGLFGAVAALALFFGTFRILLEPPGFFVDQGSMGLDALRLLKGHCLPPFHLIYLNSPPLIIYCLAAWFALFPATTLSLHLFFLTVSWAGMLFFYWFLRDLGGKRWALTGLAVLAVMRWYFLVARDGFPSIEAPFFTFLVLLFWWKALQTRNMAYYALGGFFLGAGYYAYQSLKVLPLLVVILALYEIKMKIPGLRWKGTALMGGVFLAVASPVLYSWIQQGSLGARESFLWIGQEIITKKSLAPLFKNLTDWALMFNRLEAPYPFKWAEGHRLLDDSASFLLWIGFFHALRYWKNRACFYSFTGFLVMSLPLILASDRLMAERIAGAAPFAASLAALPVLALLRGTRERLGRVPSLLWVSLALAFALSVYQNYDVYFRQQAGDRDNWHSFTPEATRVAETVVSHPGVAYELAPCFWGQETVKFLCFDQAGRVRPLDLQQALRPKAPPPGNLCFVLDQGKRPTLELLKKVYRGGEEELKDPWGVPMAYLYYWRGGPGRECRPLEERGLLGRYFESGDGSGSPSAVRWDPLLNFTHLSDFLVPGPGFFVQWNGVLNAPQKGKYGFSILSKDHGKLWVDGRPVIDTWVSSQASIKLSKGEHRIDLSDGRTRFGEIRMDFHLLWMPPGQSHFSLVPMMAFGKLPRH